MKNGNPKSSERGAYLVELAILLPLLLLMVMGTVEIGLLFYNKQVVTNSSREGARYGSVAAATVDDIKGAVQSYCNDRLITFGSTPAVNTVVDRVILDPLNPFGTPATVTVSYIYSFLVPELLGLDATMQLSAESMMRMERAL